jgi:calcium-activated chloride channel regulator 4
VDFIYSEITQGGNPVLAMKVVATIDRPGENDRFELDLKDNGQGADNRRNDGVYSRYFTAYTNVGRYAFSIRASNPNGTAIVRAFKTAGSWGGAPAFDENNIRPYIKPTFKDEVVKGDISRTKAAEASKLQADTEGKKKLTSGKDGIPPSAITDLKVMETSLETGNVTLAWTAPGDFLRQELFVSLFTVKGRPLIGHL